MTKCGESCVGGGGGRPGGDVRHMIGRESDKDNDEMDGDEGGENADMVSEGVGDRGGDKPTGPRRKTRDEAVARMR